MRGYKEGKFLVFELDNGRTVRYDLSTGDAIGAKGKPVQSAAHLTRGVNMRDILNSIEDKNYRNYLRWIWTKKCSHGVTNLSTVLKEARYHQNAEQFFSAGVSDLSDMWHKFSNVPTGLIRLAREHNLTLTSDFVDAYKESPDFFHLLFSMHFVQMNPKFMLMNFNRPYQRNPKKEFRFEQLKRHGYTEKALLLYLDEIITYEALSENEVITNLVDYVRMMSTLSAKFDRYLRHLLTSHKIAIRNYNRLIKEHSEEIFKKRIRPELAFKTRDYEVLVPQTTQDIKDEAVQQHNCVASYIDDVIEGNCSIVMMRRRKEPEKSCVTIEVKGYEVVQALRTFNHPPTEPEMEALDKYKTYLEGLANAVKRNESKTDKAVPQCAD